MISCRSSVANMAYSIAVDAPFLAIVPCCWPGDAVFILSAIAVAAAALEDGLMGFVSSADSHGAGDGGKGGNENELHGFYFQ